MVTGYLTAPGKITRSRRNLGPQMHSIHGPSAYGHVLMPANLDPSYGLNSSTALWMTWESQRLWVPSQKEKPDR